MELEQFENMSLTEIQEFQQKNREKIEKNRKKVKEQKARTHRLIVRGSIAESMVPGAEYMNDDQFMKRLYELIYQS